jgi:hypothetical protein
VTTSASPSMRTSVRSTTDRPPDQPTVTYSERGQWR